MGILAAIAQLKTTSGKVESGVELMFLSKRIPFKTVVRIRIGQTDFYAIVGVIADSRCERIRRIAQLHRQVVLVS